MTRKLTLVLALCVSLFSASAARAQTDIPNRGHAPNGADGLGRLDLRVMDDAGQPVRGASAHLTSNRRGGFVCETWNSTDAQGVAVLPPLHVGTLKLTVQAPGYRTQTLNLSPDALAQPVRVTLARS